MTLNCDLPRHIYGFVRAEFLHNLEAHHGEVEECAIFGIASEPNRTLGFHVQLKTGACFWRLPLHALCWKVGAASRPLRLLAPWDCFGYEVSAHAYTYLRHQDCTVYFADGTTEGGEYVCTVDWCANGYSDAPDQHKCAHLVKLDDGNFAAQPNNRLLWVEPSFTDTPGERPGYRANTHLWFGEVSA